MSDVLSIAGLHDVKPRSSLDVNKPYLFQIKGVKHIAPVEFTDHAGRFGPQGATIQTHQDTGQIKFTLIPLDEDSRDPLPNVKPIFDSIYLPDETYMDEQQFLDAARQLKSVLVHAEVEINDNGEFVPGDMNDAIVELRTRGYTDRAGNERIAVNWPEFSEDA